MTGADLRFEVVDGVASIEERAWTALFPTDPEGWHYHRAVEGAPPPGFELKAVAVRRSDTLIAAAPIFRVTYRLDTPLQGRWRQLGDWLHRTMPTWVSLPVLCVGSPLTDRCHLGLRPDLNQDDRASAIQSLLAGLDRFASAERVPLLAFKDMTASDAGRVESHLTKARFGRIASLPVCVLDLPFAREADYIASLSANNRSTLRRKIKRVGNVDVSIVRSITGLEQDIFDLYEETRRNSRFDYGDFEQLSPAYFQRVVEELGGHAAVVLCRVEGELLAFKLMLMSQSRVIDKFWGMRSPRGRDHNLFFVAWMACVRYCLQNNIRTLQAGQTAYGQKAKLGCRLEPRWIYFRHRNPVMNWIFSTLSPLFAFDKLDPELKEVSTKAQAG